MLEFAFISYNIYEEGEVTSITLQKLVPDDTATVKEIKVMLLKKLKLDTEKFDLVIASLGKGKIFERFPDDFKANDFNPKVWVLAYQVPKL